MVCPQWRGSFRAARMQAATAPPSGPDLPRNGGAALELPESVIETVGSATGALAPAMEGQL